MTSSIAARLVLLPVNFYRRFISPILPSVCRYYPTCSTYAVQAISTHGAARGSWLALRRLSSCGPWSRREQVDPVPPRREPHRHRSSSSSGSTCTATSTTPNPLGTDLQLQGSSPT